MPGLLPANLKALWRNFDGMRASWLIEFDLVLTRGAAPTTVRVATSSIPAWTRGAYKADVKSIDPHTRGMGILDTGLRFSEMKVELKDDERFWSKLISGPMGRGVRRSPVRVYVADRRLASFADVFPYFVGVIDHWDIDNEFSITLYLRPNDVQMRRPFPEFQLNDLLYPFGDPDAWGRYGSYAYGILNSSGTTRTGKVPCFLIDSTDHSYYVVNHAAEITDVYADGEPLTEWSAPLTVDGGWDVQRVQLPEDMGEAAITCDLKGARDAAGVVITNPASAAAHMLRNHVIGNPEGTRWQSGAYFSSSPGIHVAAGAGFLKVHAFMLQRNRHCAHLIEGDEQHLGEIVLNELLASDYVHAYYRNDGKIDLFIYDPAQRRPTTDDLYIRNTDIMQFTPNYDGAGVVRRISTQYDLDPVADQYRNALEVADVSVPSEGSFSFQQPWGPANDGEKVLADSAPDAA